MVEQGCLLLLLSDLRRVPKVQNVVLQKIIAVDLLYVDLHLQ